LFSLYWYSSQVTSGVIEQVWDTTGLAGYQITNITLFPPSADATYSLLIRNPTDYTVTISTDLDFYFGNATVSQRVGELNVKDLKLPAQSTKTIDLDVHIDFITLSILQGTELKTARLVGSVEGIVAYLFFTFYQTINVDKTISSF